MDKIDKVVNYADELLEATRTRPERLLDSASSTTKWKTIYQKLLDVYLEENKKELKCPKLKCTSHLLDKLVHREHLNTLVINLYPGNEGYSLMLKGRNGADSETIRLPYEETELLDYVDAEQLPPLLVDLLDRVQSNIFYCGCIIAEVRDYRRSVNSSCDTRYVLLRPTPQTLLCDINSMTTGSLKWTTEDKLQLESQLLLHINEPLCLDPNPVVCLISNRFNYQKYKLNHHALKRAARQYSQASLNKKRKLAQSSAPKHLRLYDFLNKRKDKVKPSPSVNLKVGKTCVDMWRQRDVHLTMPENIEVEKYAKLLEKPKIINDNTPIVVEEYTFETEKSHGKVNYSKLTIMQRMNEEFYLGQLYVDRDYVEGKSQGSTCKFALGTKANVEKYIRQFREIFTEEGRRQVKISHLVPGQCPVVSYTQTLHTVVTTTTGNSQQSTTTVTQACGLATNITGQLGISVSGTDNSSRKPTPIRLSLSLNPQPVSGSTASVPVTPVTAQLTLNLQQQQQLAATQRIRQMNIYQGLQRSPSSAGSQVSTPTIPLGLVAVATTSASAKSIKTLTSSSSSTSVTTTTTPPPSTSTVQGSASPGRGLHKLDSSTQGASSTTHPLSANIVQALSGCHAQSSTLTSPVPGDPQYSTTSQQSTPSTTTLCTTGATPPPNINIASMTNVAPNINIQNLSLQGVNIAANIQGLPNLHNVQCHGLETDFILLTTGRNTTNAATVQSLVTMVTAAPSSTTTPSVTSVSGSATSGMLQLPLGVTGNLTQFVAGIKGAQGIRPGTPLLLSQIAGQPGQQVQLLNAASLSQARTQGVTHTSQTATLTNKSNVSSSASTNTAQSTTLTHLQATAAQPQVLTTQHLVQLTSQQQLTQLALQQQKLQGQSQQKLTLPQLQQPQKLTKQQQLQFLQQVQQKQKLTAGQMQHVQRQQSGIILTTTPTTQENKTKKKKSLSSSPKSS